MINVGVIGLGVIAKYYLAAFPESGTARLAAVCDLNADKTRVYLGSEITVWQDYTALLADPAIEAVIINLPNDLHYAACYAALKAGKHVCCEKPLTLNHQQALDLQQVAIQVQKTLFTAFHRRYNQPLTELKARIPATEQIARVDIYYREKIEEHAGNDTWYLDPAKCGGGCIADNGPNAFDTLAWLLGPLRVINVEVVRDDRDIDIEAIIDLETHSGLAVRTWLDWAWAHGEDKRVVFTLKNGEQLAGDMLEGSVAFKSSLFHEYARVIDDFALHIEQHRGRGEEGVTATALVDHCYAIEKSGAVL